jgi:hypothetical protein
MTNETSSARWQYVFAQLLRYVIAPLVLFFSGFFTADFLLSGVYTWPRTSRVVVLTLTMGVLAYEFIYKEQRAHSLDSHGQPLKAVLYSCAVPYIAGVAALIALARLAARATAGN